MEEIQFDIYTLEIMWDKIFILWNVILTCSILPSFQTFCYALNFYDISLSSDLFFSLQISSLIKSDAVTCNLTKEKKTLKANNKKNPNIFVLIFCRPLFLILDGIQETVKAVIDMLSCSWKIHFLCLFAIWDF